MKRKKSELETIYEKDPKTNSFFIDIAIDTYNDIFNELDPAPFRKRDIDPDLNDFIENCSSDIPFKYDISLRFQIPKEARDTEKEERIKTGLKTYFSFNMHSAEKELKKIYEKGLFYIFISFSFLFFAFFLETIIPENVLFNTLLEGLFIGGWVFLWEALYSFAFERKGVNYEFKQYRRLHFAQISFNSIQLEQAEE